MCLNSQRIHNNKTEKKAAAAAATVTAAGCQQHYKLHRRDCFYSFHGNPFEFSTPFVIVYAIAPIDDGWKDRKRFSRFASALASLLLLLFSPRKRKSENDSRLIFRLCMLDKNEIRWWNGAIKRQPLGITIQRQKS